MRPGLELGEKVPQRRRRQPPRRNPFWTSRRERGRASATPLPGPFRLLLGSPLGSRSRWSHALGSKRRAPGRPLPLGPLKDPCMHLAQAVSPLRAYLDMVTRSSGRVRGTAPSRPSTPFGPRALARRTLRVCTRHPPAAQAGATPAPNRTPAPAAHRRCGAGGCGGRPPGTAQRPVAERRDRPPHRPGPVPRSGRELRPAAPFGRAREGEAACGLGRCVLPGGQVCALPALFRTPSRRPSGRHTWAGVS
jgi:hypothetical protein